MKVKRNRSIFDAVLKEKIAQNVFNLSYTNSLTLDSGILYPLAVYETVPGDVFFGGSSVFLRTEPLVAPLFTNIDIEVRYFWVPNRFVWNNWTHFITNQQPGVKYADLKEFDGVHPFIFSNGALDNWSDLGRLADFMGIPATYKGDFAINSLPFRCYNLIYNEFFRDENLIDPAPLSFGDGEDDPDDFILRRVCWAKDRFTTCLPWPQKGEDVSFDALVRILGKKDPDFAEGIRYPGDGLHDTTHMPRIMRPKDITGDDSDLFIPDLGEYNDSGELTGNLDYIQVGQKDTFQQGNMFSMAAGYSSVNELPLSGGGYAGREYARLLLDPNGSLGADVSIRRLRQASALQRILEKKALMGSRYSEYILGFFGVRIPDSELNRPVYLGGGSSPISVHPVEQTSATVAGETPQGTQVGKGIGAGLFNFSRPWMFNDYGHLMAVGYIRPKASYYQGLRREFFRFGKDDYYNPDYQLLGEEEVYKAEVCLKTGTDNPSGKTFGYQSRYAYLKSREDEIHGNLKGDMISWVQPRVFDPGVDVNLNSEFVKCTPYENNNFAVNGRPHYIVDVHHSIEARRPLYYLPVLKPGQL